jgi:crossover junction endonuclease MUS81
MTTKSQLQVHSRFFVKETSKLNETIDFIATVTNVIIASHRQTDLHVIPTRYLSRSSYCGLQTKLRTVNPADERSAATAKMSFLISYEAYQELNDKSASQTLREKWGRMLMCVKGMSAEKAGELLAVWDTPRALWEDLKRHEEASIGEPAPEQGKGKKKVKGKEAFFNDMIQGEFRKSIGQALSKTVGSSSPF